MSRELEGAVLVVLGVITARITLEGTYLAYVKPGLMIPLLLTSVVLAGLGLATLRGGGARPNALPTAAAGTAVAHRPPRIGLFLLAPVAILVVVAPQPLGAFAAGRGTTNSLPTEFASQLAPLSRTADEPVELSISEAVLRTYAEGDASIEGVPVRLAGFVAGSDEPAAFHLSRFAVACCAADATPRQVLVVGVQEVLDEDTWLEVVAVWEGTTREEGDHPVPVVRMLSYELIDAPAEPYEYAAY